MHIEALFYSQIFTERQEGRQENDGSRISKYQCLCPTHQQVSLFIVYCCVYHLIYVLLSDSNDRVLVTRHV